MKISLPECQTIIEPFKIKTVEPIFQLSEEERKNEIKKHHYNLFSLPADKVFFDLLTDSGTSAMSNTQWSAFMLGDESYAGARSFYKFKRTIQDLTGFQCVIPTHQGRSAEFLLMSALKPKGKKILGNTHFDTTRANIEVSGGEALDLPDSEESIFKGNMNLKKLSTLLETESSNVSAVIVTVTNNSIGGLPVSMENIKKVKTLCQKHGVFFFLDMARFAENSFFIKKYEKAYSDLSVREIAKKMLHLADGVLMSAKKDAFCNIGGFFATSYQKLIEDMQALMVVTEGFPTYGGLAGRDLEAISIGLEEILDESYLNYRLASVRYFAEGLKKAGYKLVHPFGGHAVYIDAGQTLPHIPSLEYPGQALSVALYEYIGIRSVEVGTVMLGSYDKKTGKEIPAPQELVRLAMPRRVYTQSHVDYMIEKASYLQTYLKELKGYKITYQAKVLRHFTAHFQPL